MIRLSANKGKDFLDYRVCQSNTIEIYDIAVNSNRRQRIGTSLINKLIEEIKDDDKKIIFAFTRFDNNVAHKFYKARGFEGTTIKNFYPEGDATIFVKEI